jgi:hypothetical protein
MVKIGNGVWKLDGTSELAHVLEEFVAERIPTNVKRDAVTRIPDVIFAGPVVCAETLPAAVQKGHLRASQ